MLMIFKVTPRRATEIRSLWAELYGGEVPCRLEADEIRQGTVADLHWWNLRSVSSRQLVWMLRRLTNGEDLETAVAGCGLSPAATSLLAPLIRCYPNL